MAEPDGEWMLVGRLAGSLGVRGEIKVEPLTDFPDRFKRISVVYLGPSRRAIRVQRARMHAGRPALKLEGVDTPERARALGTADIYVPRAEAAELPEGHFYLDDLIGVTVVSEDGDEVGSVTEVLRTGSNDVYVVNEGRDAILVPATREAVKELDFGLRRMVVERWALEPPE